MSITDCCSVQTQKIYIFTAFRFIFCLFLHYFVALAVRAALGIGTYAYAKCNAVCLLLYIVCLHLCGVL